MRVHYDNEVDAMYIRLGNQKPDGVVEISEGVNLDMASLMFKLSGWVMVKLLDV